MHTKTQSVTLLFVAEIAAMSLWFVAAAILTDLRAEVVLSPQLSAALSSSVQAGFVVGALLVASTGVADRLDPRFVFSIASLIAALANLLVIWIPPDSWIAVFLRFTIGFALAGVYPVGMKIVVGWGVRDRGFLVGLVVGGLTIGSAFPHLLSFIGGSNWQLTSILASSLALFAAILIWLVQLGPHHAAAARFRPDAALLAWRNTRIRYAILGYLGHMWELYVMWSWIAAALVVSYSERIEIGAATELAKITTFVAISAGALLCPVAGVYADRVGKAQVTIIAMMISGISAIAAAVVFGGPVWLVSIVVVLWGMSVIPDSAQFSALVADFAPPDQAGSVMTLQTALGFALTVITVQLAPLVAQSFGWPLVFVLLALGPFLGIVAMRRLQKYRPTGVETA